MDVSGQEQGQGQVPVTIKVVATMVSENLMDLWEIIDNNGKPSETLRALKRVHDPVCKLIDSLESMRVMTDMMQAMQEGRPALDTKEEDKEIAEELVEQYDRVREEIGSDNG